MGTDFYRDRTVCLDRCTEYDAETVTATVRRQMEEMGLTPSFFAGKKTVIKPNLVSPYPPENAVTTHPVLTEAVASILREWHADVCIAESGGGLFTEALLQKTYRVTGTLSAAQNAGVTLNYDTGSGTLCTPNGHTSKSFPIITPILEADIIVNLPKLKTHTLAMMTAASKNLFGCVPGLQKVEMHARFSDQQIFLSALTDLACALCEQKEVINICDAVVGMEGNGPSGGNPVEIGYLIAGRNPFAVDLLCAAVLGLENAPMVEQAISRGLCPQKADELIVRGEPLTRAGVPDVKMPDTSLGEFLTRLPKFLRPRPQIDPRKCVGCGKCAENCPPKIITIEPRKNGKGLAHIHRADCLRCFCCQDMCPFHAVRIHKNIIFRLVK